MRQGETVLAGADTAGLDAEILARTMVGEESEVAERRARPLGEVRLQVEDLGVRGAGGIGVDGIGFAVRSGEIYGIAGDGGPAALGRQRPKTPARARAPGGGQRAHRPLAHPRPRRERLPDGP